MENSRELPGMGPKTETKRLTKEQWLALQAQIRADNKMRRYVLHQVYRRGSFSVMY